MFYQLINNTQIEKYFSTIFNVTVLSMLALNLLQPLLVYETAHTILTTFRN